MTTELPEGFRPFVEALKTHIRETQLRAITERQEADGWGTRVIDQLADEIQRAFPGLAGFSRTNIYRMRAFALASPAEIGGEVIVPQPVGRFTEPLPTGMPEATMAPPRTGPVSVALAFVVVIACRASPPSPQPRPVPAPHRPAHLDVSVLDIGADIADAPSDRTVAAPPVDASSFWADRVPRGMVAARFEDGYVRWPGATEETYDPAPPGLVDWLKSADGEVTVQVFAGPRSEIDAPDVETWALRAMARFAPQADLSERSLWPGQYFRYRRAADGTRHAELRLLQVEWRMEDDTRHRDVLVGVSERGDVLYRTFVTLDCGAAWWDAPEPPPEGPLPRALLRRGREAHSRYIVGPQPR